MGGLPPTRANAWHSPTRAATHPQAHSPLLQSMTSVGSRNYLAAAAGAEVGGFSTICLLTYTQGRLSDDTTQDAPLSWQVTWNQVQMKVQSRY
eukprot:g73070.t1